MKGISYRHGFPRPLALRHGARWHAVCTPFVRRLHSRCRQKASDISRISEEAYEQSPAGVSRRTGRHD
jgi:hypothetical protein